MSTMSAAGRSLLAGTLIEDKASPEELLASQSPPALCQELIPLILQLLFTHSGAASIVLVFQQGFEVVPQELFMKFLAAQ